MFLGKANDEMRRLIFSFLWAAMAMPVGAQSPSPVQTPPAIVFQSGVGGSGGGNNGGSDGLPVLLQTGAPSYRPARPQISCNAVSEARTRIVARFYPASPAPPPASRILARPLFDQALDSYQVNLCGYGGGNAAGPGVIIIVDYARHSGQPRLFRVDLSTGDGLDAPMLVAHGVGSDPDDDGFATRFSNTPDSLASSLGAARGAEIYSGQNGRSLRLDGLDPSNSMMRYRDIVVHSYAPERRRYFNASHLANRGGRPGISEGCFVVEPDKRDLVLETLAYGGFLYAGYSGALPDPRPKPAPANAIITFASGTGASSQSAPAQTVPAPLSVSETPGGTGGSPPIDPISPAPAAQPR
jgi:L,D-transpeptidase catalytic domain